jgi:hypothetical protein
MGFKARIAGGTMLALVVLAAIHDVPVSATQEDIQFGDLMLAEAGYSGPKRALGDLTSFDTQLKAILAAQDTVIRIAPRDEEIPFDRAREPRDLFEMRKGLCYDRSRALEKLLAMMGLESRHVAIYSTAKRGALAALLTPGNDSHALTEVKTARGWMTIDPNTRWIGLTQDGRVVDIAGLRALDAAKTAWAGEGAQPHPIFSAPFVFVRGLYSRHGRFYSPYTPVPDVNWRQLVQNFTD